MRRPTSHYSSPTSNVYDDSLISLLGQPIPHPLPGIASKIMNPHHIRMETGNR